MSTDNIYFNKTGSVRYELSEKPIASGGEGAIYDVIGSSDKVAKIYHENKRSEIRRKKIEAMLRIPASDIPECAWPREMLFQDEKFCGFVMDKLSGIGNLVDFFVYENRKNYTWKQYVVAAINIAAAVNNIHDAQLVIGDLKPDNIIIDPKNGMVRLVDTDSYQVISEDAAVYTCTVATPEYIPPELQNINFEKNNDTLYFNNKTDDFSLAVIIFKILMNGVHPFSCFSAKRSLNDLESNIKNGNSPYFNETNEENDIQLTLRSPEISILPSKLQQLFRRAFVEGRLHPNERPSAEEWFYALKDLEGHLSVCSRYSNHIYSGHLGSCPWCGLENEMAQRKARFTELLNQKQDQWRPEKPKPPVLVNKPPVQKPPAISDNNSYNDDKSNMKALAISLIFIIVMLLIIGIISANLSMEDYFYYEYSGEYALMDTYERKMPMEPHRGENYEM